jgi:hypothetical protein
VGEETHQKIVSVPEQPSRLGILGERMKLPTADDVAALLVKQQ